jgi:heptaprenyl diphosphate synthase
MRTHASGFRERRKDAALRYLPSGALFVAGLAAMPSFLFNPSLLMRTLQFFFFWFCAWAVGKRISAVATLLASASIVAFNLLVPYGLELARIGNFRITAGALLAGLERAVTVEGLILLSRATIRSDLRLPGAFGALVGESFRYFDRIMERKGGIERKDPIGGIDRLMQELWNERNVVVRSESQSAPRRPMLGILALAAFTAAAWAPWLLFFL